MVSKAVIAHLLEVLFGHDPTGPCGQGPIVGHEIGPRLVQMKAHPVGIDDLHLPDFFLHGAGFVALESELDICGGEGIAIVEREALPQLKFVDSLVAAQRPGLRQAWGHWVVGHGFDEGIMQGIAEPERRPAHHRHLRGIEPGRRDGHV